jgi:hypothetical protein
MARRFLSNAALASLLVIGIGVGIASAEGTTGAPAQAASQGSAVAESCGTTTATDTSGATRSHPILDRLQNHQMVGCWAHHNMFGCGSFHSECTFMFGSCRAFYGQQCLKQPPPDDLAPMREGTPDAANPPRARFPFGYCPTCR